MVVTVSSTVAALPKIQPTHPAREDAFGNMVRKRLKTIMDELKQASLVGSSQHRNPTPRPRRVFALNFAGYYRPSHVSPVPCLITLISRSGQIGCVWQSCPLFPAPTDDCR